VSAVRDFEDILTLVAEHAHGRPKIDTLRRLNLYSLPASGRVLWQIRADSSVGV
jgi:hypothetical protein